ncbi:MAG: hypothetical protein QW739_03530 [Candidatus Odinarchaeota archaeon]
MYSEAAIWKTIRDLNPNDNRVRIIGRVIETSGNQIVVDDGTGVILIDISNIPKESVGANVLVTGSVHQRNDSKIVIEADLINNIEHVNFEIYHKIYDLIKTHR